MWRCKGQRYRNGLWPLAEHHMSQTITWYESALGHYSGSIPLLPVLWEICDWAQWRSVHGVKCTHVCGERLLSLAAGSHNVAVAAPRLLSLFIMNPTEKFHHQTVLVVIQLWDNLWETECVCTSTVCSARVSVWLYVQDDVFVGFSWESFQEEENATAVCLFIESHLWLCADLLSHRTLKNFTCTPAFPVYMSR